MTEAAAWSPEQANRRARASGKQLSRETADQTLARWAGCRTAILQMSAGAFRPSYISDHQ